MQRVGASYNSDTSVSTRNSLNSINSVHIVLKFLGHGWNKLKTHQKLFTTSKHWQQTNEPQKTTSQTVLQLFGSCIFVYVSFLCWILYFKMCRNVFFDTASTNLFTLSCNLDEQVENRFFMAKQTERCWQQTNEPQRSTIQSVQQLFSMFVYVSLFRF